MSLQPEFTATFSIVPYCHAVGLKRSDNADTDDTDDRLSRARSETLASDSSIDDDGVSDSVFRPTSPPLPPANFSFVASSTYIPPSTSELLNRVREAKRSGKSMDEVIHELQNEFYPLLPPPGYVIPSPSLYRATVAKLERLERCGGLLNSLKRELEDEENEDSSGTEDDLNAELEYVDVVAPVPLTKKNVVSWSWRSSLWDYLELSVSISAGKRRKRQPEFDGDEEDDWAQRSVDEIKGRRLISGVRSRKRRRVI
ncbi:hypothetical protein F5051DRAFT_188158 [Lentinula edodes]|nr:hypothetical protein F5051DRAFT_188158 [Lentinula edodes]